MPTREDYDGQTPIPPERWGRDHWTTIAYAFTRAGRVMGREHLRITGAPIPGVPTSVPIKEYPTRLQGDVELHGHDDLDCLRDAEAAGILTNVGTGMHPRVTFTAPGLILGQWLVASMDSKAADLDTLTWGEALFYSGTTLGGAPC